MPSRAGAQPKFKRLKPDERRQALVLATLGCLSRFGPQGTSVREICRELDVSPGLLSHYFGSKEELIHESLGTLTRDFHERLRGYLADGERSAEQRLRSAFETYFSGPETDVERTGAYIAFWTLARTDPAVRQIQRAAYRKQRRLFESALKELAEDRGVGIDEREVAIGLVSMLDGLWLEICLDPSAFSRKAAVSMAWSWLDAFVGRRARRRRGRRNGSVR